MPTPRHASSASCAGYDIYLITSTVKRRVLLSSILGHNSTSLGSVILWSTAVHFGQCLNTVTTASRQYLLTPSVHHIPCERRRAVSLTSNTCYHCRVRNGTGRRQCYGQLRQRQCPRQ